MNKDQTRTALIAGATGVVGRELLTLLLAEPRYSRVHVLSRRSLAHEEPKLEVHEVDFDELNNHSKLFYVDDVFCCLGTTMKTAGSKAAFEKVDYQYVVNLARLANQAHARRFIMISAVGASTKSAAFYSRVKGRAERDVRDVGPPTIHIVRPSLLMADREENRPGEEIAQKLMPAINPLLAGPLKRYRGVSAKTVAETMLRLALDGPEGRQVHHFFEDS